MRFDIRNLDDAIEHAMYVFGHRTHAVTLSCVFMWFGSLKVVGAKTATSVIAETIYLGSPEIMVPVLGVWEILIGVTLLSHRTQRVALLLLAVRLPGTVLALILRPDVCFVESPFVPSIAGQYIIKDFLLFSVACMVGGYVKQHPHRLARQRGKNAIE